MRKLMAVVAMLAIMLLAAAPAMADEIEIEGDDGVFFTSNVEDLVPGSICSTSARSLF